MEDKTGIAFKSSTALAVCCWRVVLLSVFVISIQITWAATKDSTNTSIKTAPYYINAEQQRIDELDGAFDGKVTLDDSASTVFATKTYITLIDSIESLIERSKKFDDAHKKLFIENLYLRLHAVNERNYKSVKRFNNVFRFIQTELNAMQQNNLTTVLASNIPQAFNTFNLYKNDPVAEQFLVLAGNYRPDLVFKYFDMYRKQEYALRVLEATAKAAPVTVKRYFNPNDPIYEALKTSEDTVVKLILKIKDKYTRRTNAFTLIDDIASGKLTMEKADAIGKNPEKYLHAMLSIRSHRLPLGAHSVDSELEIYALKFIRVLNDLHNDKDGVRFASIENFTPDELYTLMVYSEEEIFTSTFNGLFNRLMLKLGPVSGFEFLGSVGDNRFRTFVKMSAGYGKLTPFLRSMTALHQQMLMIKFASNLQDYNDLSQAVEVADAFGSITDTLVLKILRSTIKVEYIKAKTKNDQRGMTIYGLLSNLFVDRSINNSDWFNSVSTQYSLPSFDRIANNKLFDRDGVDRWLIYFYDDEDGDASFAAFMRTFKDTAWTVVDSNSYIIIQSKSGKPVHIYANKPKHEYDGQELLEKIFSDNDYEPSVMVHRGHSYYAFKTIEKIKDNTQIFVLGSCGGYHSISSIIERSPEASIISSKQIGTMHVNNPMLKLIANNIRTGKDVEWQPLWDNLALEVKDNAKAYERYLDYIPPHKNLGAIFIKTYNRLMETEL